MPRSRSPVPACRRIGRSHKPDRSGNPCPRWSGDNRYQRQPAAPVVFAHEQSRGPSRRAALRGSGHVRQFPAAAFRHRRCRASARSRRSCGCRSSATRQSSTSRCVGVPWDGGTTNRPGARHGPREIRNMSTLMRRVHHVSLVAPYELCRVGDHGDAPVNPIDLANSLKRIEALLRRGCTRPARRRCRPAATILSPCRSCARSPASGRSGSSISTPIPTPATAISAARNTRTARRSAARSRRG